jgi:hypothetical protein
MKLSEIREMIESLDKKYEGAVMLYDYIDYECGEYIIFEYVRKTKDEIKSYREKKHKNRITNVKRKITKLKNMKSVGIEISTDIIEELEKELKELTNAATS